MRSEVAIVAGIAKATVAGRSTIDWESWVGDYALIPETSNCAVGHKLKARYVGLRTVIAFPTAHSETALCKQANPHKVGSFHHAPYLASKFLGIESQCFVVVSRVKRSLSTLGRGL